MCYFCKEITEFGLFNCVPCNIRHPYIPSINVTFSSCFWFCVLYTDTRSGIRHHKTANMFRISCELEEYGGKGNSSCAINFTTHNVKILAMALLWVIKHLTIILVGTNIVHHVFHCCLFILLHWLTPPQAQVVSHWLPTTVAWVRVRAACGVCGVQSDTGAGFLWVLRFPLPIIPPISPSSESTGAGIIGLLVAAVLSGPNWTPPPHYTKLISTPPPTIHYGTQKTFNKA
jgi:hypothetical protein